MERNANDDGVVECIQNLECGLINIFEEMQRTNILLKEIAENIGYVGEAVERIDEE